MGQVLTLVVRLEEVNCGVCGGVYAINETYHTQAYQKGTSWTCPYCKTGWGFSGDSENERLKRDLAAERARKECALSEANEQRARALKAERSRERLNRRARAAMCPCCPRTFIQLRRHLATKHPEYVAKK